MVRRSDGSYLVEWFVIVAVVTILVTRAYLAKTGYPQIGEGNLHIAHALFGGALLGIAMFFMLSFTGRVTRHVAVLVGGIGFGLFLDEVGKFVTKDNDYFYQPAVAIMYIVLVLLLVANHLVNDVREVTAKSALVNGASTTTDALAGGITRTERDRALTSLGKAKELGAHPDAVDGVSTALSAAPVVKPNLLDRFYARITHAEGSIIVGPKATIAVAVLLTVFNISGLVHGLRHVINHPNPGVTALGQLGGSAVASALCILAFVGLVRRVGGLWPLRLLRTAALVTMLLTQVFNFVTEQFGALINVGVGLIALLVFSYRINALGGDAEVVADK
ncbi:MAG: hypothetical protein QM728_00560 [Gordonia sp. (in: high G+C Gram-positive bacteria)]|uniref:hypothetical protein n=1 Tax=Gordonia sp. (in: high G+C Gram-positive bacteria) TaxID=84139 RepID=UPI0039E39B05